MKNNKGFTLVELLVVIAIIAVLSAIAIVNLNLARIKGNDSTTKANLAALPGAGEVYYDDNGWSYSLLKENNFTTIVDPLLFGIL